MMYNEMYAIAETTDKGYTIASFKVTEYKEYRLRYEIIKPFQRVLSLDDYEHIDEIRPALTMYKLHRESLREFSNYAPDAISNTKHEHYEDLGIVTAYDAYPSNSYSPMWTFVATVTE